VIVTTTDLATAHHPDRFPERRRSGRQWSCRRPSSAGRKRHRLELVRRRFGAHAALRFAPARSQAAVIGLLADSNLSDAAAQLSEVQAAADATGLKLVVLRAGSAGNIDAAFAMLVARQIGALAVGASLGTAKALGLEVPPNALAGADEVIP
jgi:hypothetical protein